MPIGSEFAADGEASGDWATTEPRSEGFRVEGLRALGLRVEGFRV